MYEACFGVSLFTFFLITLYHIHTIFCFTVHWLCNVPSKIVTFNLFPFPYQGICLTSLNLIANPIFPHPPAFCRTEARSYKLLSSSSSSGEGQRGSTQFYILHQSINFHLFYNLPNSAKLQIYNIQAKFAKIINLE